MSTHANKTERNESHVAHEVPQKQRESKSALQFVNNRPEALAQRRLQEMVDNRQQAKQGVAQLVKVGTGFHVEDRSSQANPWIYVSMYELDAPINVIVGDEGTVPEDYMGVAQFCSVMSAEWLESGATLFSELDGDRKSEIVEIVLANSTNEEQVGWGAKEISGQVKALGADDMEELAIGTRLLIYGHSHVTAARRTKDGFTQYEPENGTVNDYTVGAFVQIFGELKLVVGK
jgi:hypothetical protein